MSEHICLTALLTLPKPQQLRVIERLQQSNQQKDKFNVLNGINIDGETEARSFDDSLEKPN